MELPVGLALLFPVIATSDVSNTAIELSSVIRLPWIWTSSPPAPPRTIAPTPCPLNSLSAISAFDVPVGLPEKIPSSRLSLNEFWVTAVC